MEGIFSWGKKRTPESNVVKMRERNKDEKSPVTNPSTGEFIGMASSPEEARDMIAKHSEEMREAA